MTDKERDKDTLKLNFIFAIYFCRDERFAEPVEIVVLTVETFEESKESFLANYEFQGLPSVFSRYVQLMLLGTGDTTRYYVFWP